MENLLTRPIANSIFPITDDLIEAQAALKIKQNLILFCDLSQLAIYIYPPMTSSKFTKFETYKK